MACNLTKCKQCSRRCKTCETTKAIDGAACCKYCVAAYNLKVKPN